MCATMLLAMHLLPDEAPPQAAQQHQRWPCGRLPPKCSTLDLMLMLLGGEVLLPDEFC